MLSLRLVMACISALALSVAAIADDSAQEQQSGQTAGQQPQAKGKAMSLQDFRTAKTLNHIHHINQQEIQLSQLAKEKAQSGEVKAMADQMIRDHQDADRRVEQLARSKGIELQDFSPSTGDKAAMENLEKYSGTQFDQAYVDLMRMSHRDAVQDLEMASNETRDPQVKSLVQSLLPKLRDHQKRTASLKVPGAEQMAGKGASAKSTKSQPSGDSSS